MPVDQICSSVHGYYDQYQPPVAEADTSQASEQFQAVVLGQVWGVEGVPGKMNWTGSRISDD